MLLTQEGEEVHLREDVHNFVEVLAAEIHHDTARGCVAERGSLVDLVFTDQHHTSRVDDIGGILNKIAAAALYLIIDLVFMMDMEAGHLIPGVTVHAVNKKVNVGRVDIFRNHNAAPHCRGAGHPATGYCCLF